MNFVVLKILDDTIQENKQSTTTGKTMIQITKAQLEQATKIIVVTYESGETKWFPFNLDNMENIISEFEWISEIQIVERG